MRVAICTDQYLPLLSGVADSIVTSARELEKRGHVVRVYAPKIPGAGGSADVMLLPQLSIPGTDNAMAVTIPIGMLDDMRGFMPNVIHSHTTGVTGLAAIVCARVLKAPLLGTSHTLPAHYLHYLKLDFELARHVARWYTAWYYDRCDRVSAPSYLMLDELHAYGMKKPGAVISNGIDVERFRPLDKAACKQKHEVGPRAVLLFGRIAKEKNVYEAFDAFGCLADLGDAELVIVGDGPERERFERLVKASNVSERVRFFGAQRGEALAEMINACDALLITSQSETQSMTTLQAMACSLPVVAARAGALPEYVEDGKTGYVVAADEPRAYAEMLNKLLNDPELAKSFGEAGWRSAQRFSPEKIAEEFERFYEAAM